MKILNYVSLKLIMIAIACSFAASTPLQAGEARLNSASARSEGDARSYEAVLPPGRHVLSVTPELEYCTHTIVNAEPGRTYAFTARWVNDEQIRLEPGNGASKQIVAAGMPPAPTSCGGGL